MTRLVPRPSRRTAAAGTVAFGVLALAGLAVGGAVRAGAVDSTAGVAAVQVTTPYPMVSTQPGGSLKFELSVSAPTTEPVGLAVDGVPSGWNAVLRGGGFVVSGVTAGPGTPSTADLELDVPADARPGTYPVTVEETAKEGRSTLTIEVTVAAQVDNGIKVDADFTSLRAGPTDTFSYTLSLTNDLPEQQAFTFDATGPTGWTVSASPAVEQRASTLKIDAGATGKLDISATPAPDTTAGSYPIEVRVSNEAGQSATFTFTAEVTGTPKLALGTADERLNASGDKNQSKRIALVVTNTGTAPLEDVELTATPPSDWKVTFEPATVASVQPGQSAQVVAVVKPKKDAIAGDYALEFRASSGALSQGVTMRYSVKTSRWFGLVGIVVILAAASVLFGVYRRFGRR